MMAPTSNVAVREHHRDPALHDQTRLSPQARVDLRRRLLVLVEKREAREIPDELAGHVAHTPVVGQRSDQPARGILEVARVLPRRRRRHLLIGLARRRGAVLPAGLVPVTH
jgi:hypothetical protein